MTDLPWVLRNRGLIIARFRYESDARRYWARVSPREHFTLHRDGEQT